MNKSPNRILVVLAVGFCICLAAMLLGSPLAAQSTNRFHFWERHGRLGRCGARHAGYADERGHVYKTELYHRRGRLVFSSST